MKMPRISAYMLAFGIAATGFIEQSRAEALEAENLEIHGVVMSRTITHAGNRFYQDFSQRWQSSAAAADNNVLIRETIDPRRGSMIWVLVADQLIYRLPLSRRFADFKAHIEEAVRRGEQLSASLNQLGQSQDLAGNGL